MTTADAAPKALSLSASSRPVWWRQIAYILVLYGVYSAVRNYSGSVLSIESAMQNASDIVAFQSRIGMVSEQAIQQFFLPAEWFIKFLNIFYGTAHFIVTIGVLVWLYANQTERYIHWRNVIFGTCGIALIGYTMFPLAPPRLMPESYGFVDTMAAFGGLWSFDSNAVQSVSNQYAAMPSLHVAWSLWCAFAILPVVKSLVGRIAVALYPSLTILTIVVTGNHFWMDVVGGTAAFSGGFLLATAFERWQRRRQPGIQGLTSPVSS